MYRCIEGMCSTDTKEVRPPTKFFTMAAGFSQASHPSVLELPSHHMTHYCDATFFNHTARLWTNPPAAVLVWLSCVRPDDQYISNILMKLGTPKCFGPRTNLIENKVFCPLPKIRLSMTNCRAI